MAGGLYIKHNGPLYVLHQGNVVKFGFRVEPRHTNPMGNLHGGMMATFCDMLVPLSVHRKSDQVSNRFLPTISLQIDYLALPRWVPGWRARQSRCASRARWCLHRAWSPPMACPVRG